MTEAYNPEIEPIRESYRRSVDIAELFAALAKAQGSYETLEKSKTANAGRYSYTYATLADTISATKALHDNGLCIVQIPTTTKDAVAVTTILGHESGQWIESTVRAVPGEWTIQAIGSMITYLRRYSRQAIAGIAPDDDDGEAAVPTRKTPETHLLVDPANRIRPTRGTAGVVSQAYVPAAASPEQTRNIFSEPPAPQPAHDSVTGELAKPHQISTAGLTNIAWATLFVATIKAAKTLAELEAWNDENKSTLDKLSAEAPKIFDRISWNIKDRAKAIALAEKNGGEAIDKADQKYVSEATAKNALAGGTAK